MKKLLSLPTRKTITELKHIYLERMNAYLEHIKPEHVAHILRPFKFTVEIKEQLRIYINSPSNIQIASNAPPKEIFKLTEPLESISKYSKSITVSEHRILFKQFLAQFPGNKTLENYRIVPQPDGYKATTEDYHTDLYAASIKQGKQFYLCVVTTDPNATTVYIPDPVPLLKCNYNYDRNEVLNSALYETIVSTSTNPLYACKVSFDLLLHVSTQALQSMVQDDTIPVKQLTPNTLYEMGDTVHISPTPPEKRAAPTAPRLLYALFAREKGEIPYF